MAALYLCLFFLFILSGCALTPTPLIKASMEGRTGDVKSMIDGGADINEKGTLPNATKYAPKYFIKSTPLMAAAHYGQVETASFLLSRGADIDAENFLCMSAVHLATVGRKKDAVSLLIKKGANLNPNEASSAFCYVFTTPLQMAAYNGDLEIVKLLLKNGAEIDKGSYCGYTPLLFAAQEGHYATVEYLVKRGADTKIKTRNQLGCMDPTTPLKIAEKQKHPSVVKFLKDAQAGLIPVQRLVPSPPEDPSEVAAFEKEAKRFRELQEKPAFSEEARKYKAQAEFAFQQKRFEDAEGLYAKALKVAPWWPDGHFNRALILGELSRYEEAIREMKRYLLLAPEAQDATAAQDRIYQWEGVSE